MDLYFTDHQKKYVIGWHRSSPYYTLQCWENLYTYDGKFCRSTLRLKEMSISEFKAAFVEYKKEFTGAVSVTQRFKALLKNKEGY